MDLNELHAAVMRSGNVCLLHEQGTVEGCAGCFEEPPPTVREALLLEAFRKVPPVTQDFFYACMRTRAAKNQDYTMGKQEIDEVANFREGGGFIDLSMPKVWWVYFWKHLCAIIAWIKTEKVATEPLWKRCMDIAVYASLLVVISMERGEQGPVKIEDYLPAKDS